MVLFVFSTEGLAQSKSTADKTAATKVAQWIENELNVHPGKRKLATQCDSYERILTVQAAKALGIPLSELTEESEGLEFQSLLTDTGKAVNASNTKTASQNETSVAISRTSPNIVVAGANDTRTLLNASNVFGMPSYYTSDFGKTWKTAFMPVVEGYRSNGDPAIASGPDGTIYYAYLIADEDFGVRSNLMVSTSKDGKQWTNNSFVLANDEAPEDLLYLEDKEEICIDQSPKSPYFGRVYLIWIHFELNLVTNEVISKLQLVYSDDKANSWSEPIIIEEADGQFPGVKTGNQGEIFVSFSKNSPFMHMLYVSRNGGLSFTPHEIAEFTNFPENVTGRSSLKGVTGFRCYPYTSFDIDLLSNTIHFVYGDWYNDEEAAIYYISSSDFGNNWTSPAAVGYKTSFPSGSTPHDRFFPWVTFNQKSGDALLTYYSSEHDDENKLIGAFRIKLNGQQETSKALGNDFSASRIALQAGGSTPFLGDYIGSDVVDTVYAAAWTQGTATSADGEVYVYVGVPNHPSTSVGPSIVKSDRLRLASVFPNPSIGTDIHFNYYAPKATHASLVLYSTDGKRIATIWSGNILEGSGIETASVKNITLGAYILSLESPEARDEMKVVVK